MIFVIVVVSESSKSSNGEHSNNLFYQECISLIKAFSPEEAKQKAIDYANSENTSYENTYGQTVTWVVKQIVEVSDVLEDDLDLHADAVDLYVRGFYDYGAYQNLYGLTQN